MYHSRPPLGITVITLPEVLVITVISDEIYSQVPFSFPMILIPLFIASSTTIGGYF